MPNGRPWPRISLITPAYNQEQYIEETIRSVLLQGYPNLEYFVIDGGSTDGTREIIAKYDKWLTYWISEPDAGQAHAINKGIVRITGDIWNWLNSDDVLCPNALKVIGNAYAANLKAIIVGDVEEFWNDATQGVLYKQQGIDFKNMVECWHERAKWYQPGIFSPVFYIQQIGRLDENLEYGLDYDYYCRLTCLTHPVYLNTTVARARLHRRSKTITSGHLFALENIPVSSRYWEMLPDIDVPRHVLSDAALKFRAGAKSIMGGRIQGLKLMKDALLIDGLGAIIFNLTDIPHWAIKRLRTKISWQ
jgi:glycosyltransferase involved in cell wall biosynthesis